MSDGTLTGKGTGLFATIVGFAFAAIGLLLMIPVAPMLLLARDARDLTGGIAGSVVCILLMIAGVVLLLREKTPAPVLRIFYIAFGALAMLTGLGMIAFGLFQFSQGQYVNPKSLPMSGLFLLIGGFWIKRGVSTSGLPDHNT